MTSKKQFLQWLCYVITKDHEAYLEHRRSNGGIPHAWHLKVFAGFEAKESTGIECIGLQLYENGERSMINMEIGGSFRPRFSHRVKAGDSRGCVNQLLLDLEEIFDSHSSWLNEDYCQRFMQKKSAYGFLPELSLFQ